MKPEKTMIRVQNLFVNQRVMIGRIGLYAISGVLLLSLTGCFRGLPSEKPPIHLNPNMDSQEKYKPQAKSEFFADGMTMRLPVEGTVARGDLRADDVYYTGKTAGGKTVKKLPVAITMDLLKRGQERYNIYCAPCHSPLGDGAGIIVKKGMLPPPNFHTDQVRNFDDGYFFEVISNGVRNMPGYKHQIAVADRWAIVAYIRALQRSQNASVKDLPEEKRAEYGIR